MKHNWEKGWIIQLFPFPRGACWGGVGERRGRKENSAGGKGENVASDGDCETLPYFSFHGVDRGNKSTLLFCALIVFYIECKMTSNDRNVRSSKLVKFILYSEKCLQV